MGNFTPWTQERIKKYRKEYHSKYKNFFVFDIETVPDEEMLISIGTEEEKEKFNKDEFLPIPFHRIVAVSVMTIKDREIYSLKSISSTDEMALLNIFWEEFKNAHTKDQNSNGISDFPVIITVNGKDFDVPVVKSRSLKYVHQIKYSFYISIILDKFDKFEDRYPRYTNKYSLYHIDIPLDLFGKKMSLKNLCYLCNIPVKIEGDGKKVKNYFKDGDLERISRYCLEDTKATAQLFAYINHYFLFDTYKFPTVEEIDSIQGEAKVI